MIRYFGIIRLALIISIIVVGGATANLAQAPAPPASPPRCGPGLSDAKNAAADSRCFELRTYTVDPAGPGSLDLLHSRFRDHTNALFRKHGMTIVGFWHPTNKPNTLIYLLAYTDRAARDTAWAGFQADPEWAKVRTAMSVKVAVDAVFMSATDYSPMKQGT